MEPANKKIRIEPLENYGAPIKKNANHPTEADYFRLMNEIMEMRILTTVLNNKLDGIINKNKEVINSI